MSQSDNQAALEGDFRAAMRLLASGVALVTTSDAAGAPCGIAMTAFMSLSMDPPSLLLAINRTASLLAPLEANGRFAVNILAADQAQACQTFVTAPVSYTHLDVYKRQPHRRSSLSRARRRAACRRRSGHS